MSKLAAALVIAALLVAIAPGRAAGEPTRAAMESYFAGEKRGGLVLAGMGAAGLGTGAILVTRDSDLARGAGYPALAIGAAHLAAGVFVYLSSDRRIDRFGPAIDRDPTAFAAAERERIAGVRRQFLILKIVEGALIAGGTAAAIYGLSDDRDLAAGIGIGIAAEATATLIFDIVADRRAAHYLGALRLSATRDGATALYATSF